MPRRRSEQDSDWTRRYNQGEHDADDTDSVQHFSKRSKFAREVKMRRTAEIRAAKEELSGDIESLPIGRVVQVYSVYVEVLCEGQMFLAVWRRTHQRMADSNVIVGDRVRLRSTGKAHEAGRPEAVIEQVLPRTSILLRQNSFRKDLPDPIVANAQQMLIVASILQPRPKWGLVDRMLIAAESGGLKPIICLNKLDLAPEDPEACEQAQSVLTHYQTLGITTLQTSTQSILGIEDLHQLLANRETVLAGHSGVGKSSLIHAIAPGTDIRIGDISTFNEKGRHTTTSARRYDLPGNAIVLDTPGVKQFGLINITPDALLNFFPDVANETAPPWRTESYERILESL